MVRKEAPHKRRASQFANCSKRGNAAFDKAVRKLGNIVFLDSEKLGKFSPENYDRLALLGKQLLAAVKALQADDGTTSRGANRVRLPGSLPSKTLVAARIAELFNHFRGKDPVIRDRDAASAAEALWRASGGKSSKAKDIEESWRAHFRAVKRQNKTLMGRRGVCTPSQA
jgi:hypothetical protein